MNIIYLIIIAILIIPQTRKPIQVAMHSLLAKINPSVIDVDDRDTISYADWELQDLNGKVIEFSELKGKVVFLNFWATWCPPCIAEMPALQELYDDYRDKIEFILVSNEDAATIKRFFDKKGYYLTNYTPLTDYPADFNVRSIPRTYLISKDGKVVIDKKGAANWNGKKIRQQIDDLLK